MEQEKDPQPGSETTPPEPNTPATPDAGDDGASDEGKEKEPA